MQRLTILIAITLVLSSPISADEDSILLDRDIFYWKPAGPDIEIPDIFLLLEPNSFDSVLFTDGIVFPLVLPDEPGVPDRRIEPGPDDAAFNPEWDPPGLQLPDPEWRGGIELRSFYPYGLGAAFVKEGDPVVYGLSAGYDPWKHYPGWLAGNFLFDRPRQDFSVSAAWQNFKENRILAFSEWSGRIGIPRWNFDTDVRFRNHLIPSEPLSHDWAAAGGVSVTRETKHFKLKGLFDSEFLVQSDREYWRFTPDLSFSDVKSLKSGDLTYKAGVAVDLYSDGSDPLYFPEGLIMFRKHGVYSLFIETAGGDLDENTRFRFLVEEPFINPDISYFHWQKTAAGIHFTLHRLEGYTSAGLITGEMPVFGHGSLYADDLVIIYKETNLTWQLLNGNVMEINSYADYQDKGKFRYLGIYRMVLKDRDTYPSFSFDIHSGNRELVRGYRNFYCIDEDILIGTGFGISISGDMKLQSSLDYAFSSAGVEGGVSFSYSF